MIFLFLFGDLGETGGDMPGIAEWLDTRRAATAARDSVPNLINRLSVEGTGIKPKGRDSLFTVDAEFDLMLLQNAFYNG